MADFEPVLSTHLYKDGAWELDYYTSHGGYEGAKKAIAEMTPEEVCEVVSKSSLCGRGGAFFPTGRKWGFIGDAKPRYMVVNADESEPGTFKDRALMEWDPHSTIEGALIASYAIESETCYIYIRGEFAFAAKRLETAIAEAYEEGFLGEGLFGTDYRCDMYVHRGAGAYICGEETALLSSLEGDRGYPRLKPPFPAVKGAWSKPTIVNNVETVANLPHILVRGPEWFAGIGTAEKTPGPKLFCLSGHVERPGLYEGPMGMPLRELVEGDDYARGVWKDRELKAVVPGGSSVPILTPDEIDVSMDFFSLREIGSMLGSAGVIVMDETTCIANALLNVLRFYHHESCGQCTPCREGTGWIVKILKKLIRGDGTKDDIDMLVEVAQNMRGRTICPLADAAVMPCESYVEKFREDFEGYVEPASAVLKSGASHG